MKRALVIILTLFTSLAISQQVIDVKVKNGDSIVRFTVQPPVVTYTIIQYVKPSPPNQSPTVNAGADQNITLPDNNVNLVGSAIDQDGSISSLLWSKVSGPNGGIILLPGSASTSVTNLEEGIYRFSLRVSDNSGIVVIDTMSVTVNPAIAPPTDGYVLTFSSGYDKLSDMTYGGNGQYANGTISTITYKTGPGSFYSRPANVSNGTRSEVQYTESKVNPVEGAIEWDVYYEVIIPSNGCSIQWHPYTSGSSGSPFMAHEGGKLVWENWKAGSNTPHATGFTIQTGRWYHMRVEHKFGSNGYWKHWIDGKLVCSWTGQVGDGSGQYLKVGYNGWDANSGNSRIYYDNLKVYKKQ